MVEGHDVRQQHVVDERQRAVDAEAVLGDRRQRCDVGRRRRAPERRVTPEVGSDARRQLVGEAGVFVRPPVQLHPASLAWTRGFPAPHPVRTTSGALKASGLDGQGAQGVGGQGHTDRRAGRPVGGTSRLAVNDCSVWPPGSRTCTCVVDPTYTTRSTIAGTQFGP